jgi:hypothetical protein
VPRRRPVLPLEQTTTLAGTDLTTLRDLVASPEFVDGMANGFACQGGGKSYDSSWELRFDDGKGKRTRQRVEYCISGRGLNVPSSLLSLVRS